MPGQADMKKFRDDYSDYYPLVFSVLYSKLNSREDAEDICQEVFVRYYHNMEKVENARKWLMAALRFEITNYYNKKATRKSDNENIDDLFNDLNLAFENGFRDARIIIQEALENMENYNDEQEKVLFDLIAVHNFTYQMAAKQLGMTRWQAEYKYGQVEKRILQYLKNKGIKDMGDLI